MAGRRLLKELRRVDAELADDTFYPSEKACQVGKELGVVMSGSESESESGSESFTDDPVHVSDADGGFSDDYGSDDHDDLSSESSSSGEEEEEDLWRICWEEEIWMETDFT